MKEYDKYIGEWITEKRMKAGLTQGELGKKLGVSKSAICQYEKGSRAMTAVMFIKLCKVLGANPSELTGVLRS